MTYLPLAGEQGDGVDNCAASDTHGLVLIFLVGEGRHVVEDSVTRLCAGALNPYHAESPATGDPIPGTGAHRPPIRLHQNARCERGEWRGGRRIQDARASPGQQIERRQVGTSRTMSHMGGAQSDTNGTLGRGAACGAVACR
jgi:hypothetical protein